METLQTVFLEEEKMTAKELATSLDGRAYLEEITRKEELLAKENGLVVVFGYSDDNVEFRGAIDDELGAWEGGTFWVYKSGHVEESNWQEGESQKIEALWCAPDSPDWTFKTEIPHETFKIFDGTDVYCIGLVFNMKEAFGE